MSAVHLALVLEQGSSAAALGEACRNAGLEATLLLDAAGAANPAWAGLAKVLDVGVRLPGRATGDFAGARAAYEAVLFAAGRVPSCVESAAPLGLDAYRALAEWNVRAVVGARGPFAHGGLPYFAGGRLHLTDLGPNRLAGTDLAGLARQAGERAAALAAGTGGVVLASVDGAAAGDPAEFVAALLALPGVRAGSVRTVWNALQDISYDHAVPLAALQALAAASAGGELAPRRYELGYWSPAEQLALLANFWATALEKGKPGRNATARCPLPGPAGTSAAAELSAADLPGAVKELNAAIRDRNELPGTLAGLSAEDLLATLAAAFAAPLPTGPLPAVRGRLTSAPAGDARMAWTFKPALDFAPA